MSKKNKKAGKVYKSITQFEKSIFPKSYERKVLERRSREPGIFGSTLAAELLDGVRRRLAR